MRLLALRAISLACDVCTVVEWYAGRAERALYELGTALERFRIRVLAPCDCNACWYGVHGQCQRGRR